MAVAHKWVTPSKASSSVSTTRALANTSLAPLARWMVSSLRSTLGQRGATSTKSSKPMTFKARAAAPTLPAWLVSIKMNRVFMPRLSMLGWHSDVMHVRVMTPK